MQPIVALLVGAVFAQVQHAGPAAPRAPLELVQTIALPGVEGRIDHLAVDLKGHRLFVAALGNNTLEVLDVEQGTRRHTIPGLREPQGVCYLPDADRIVVANGGDGSCRVFDGATYRPIARIDCKQDADNVRFDAAANRLYVGYGNGALAVIDAARLARLADIPLPAHPESLQLETKGNRLFVNLPGAGQIGVIDRSTNQVVARWPMEPFQANFPMALDETHGRLLVGCRKPPRLVVLDSRSGRLIAALPCAGDTDDLFYDARLRRIYVSGGEGSLSLFEQTDADHYQLVTTTATAPAARTSLFVAAQGRLYVAIPHRGSQAAEIRAYGTR